jgi:hypothetical protein
MATFKSSRPAVLELAARYRDIVTELESTHSLKGAHTPEQLAEAERVLFVEMCEICLWGNATDLSLLTNLSYEDIQKLQGSEARKASEKNILVNDLHAAFDVLTAAQKAGSKDRRVDIVLDNAGFELYVDLILAGYLLASGLATNVVFHPKSIPWFVSDVLPADFGALLVALADPQSFFSAVSDEDKAAGKTPEPLSDAELSSLQFLFQHWSTMHGEGLKQSELVIFKGDLNYRKLTADVSCSCSARLPLPITNTYLGGLASYYPFHRRHWTHGTPLWRPRPRAPYLQGRCCSRTARRRGREDPSHGGRRWRQWREEVGVEWKVGCRPVLRWQGIESQPWLCTIEP